MKLTFEWDEAKAKSNFKAHGVSFELAEIVFEDGFAIGRIDDREHYVSSASSSSGVTKHEHDKYFTENSSTDVH